RQHFFSRGAVLAEPYYGSEAIVQLAEGLLMIGSEPRLVTIADGVHAWIGAGGDSNAGAIETPDGVIIVDTQQYTRLGRAFRDAALAKTRQPVPTVIYPHCHLHHPAGRPLFAPPPLLPPPTHP